MKNIQHNASARPRSSRFSPLSGLTTALSAAAALLATTAGGCMLQVEAEVADLEITQHDIPFAGIPMAGRLGEVSTTQSFTQEHSALELPEGFDSTVQAVKVELVAKSGITNFDFLTYLRVTMRAKAADAAPVDIISYEKPPGATVGNVLTIDSRNPANLLDQWKTDAAIFEVTVAGTLPEQDWTIDASIHFAGKATYKY